MTEYSRFFGGPVEAVPEYTQPEFAEVLEKIFTDGVFTDIDNELEVVETDPAALAVRVNTGEAWIQGFWYQNTAYLTKSLAVADPDNDRIDRIVLRLDTITNFKISIEVLEGTPGAEPTAPTLTQTASTYEISLAQVLVEATVTSIANAKITDEREYAAISGVDLSTLTPLSGWIPAGTFTYASATTITVATGAASIYQKGDKLRFKQTAGTYKYFYVISVADTVLTVTGGTDYTVLNEAITVPAYSHQENPLGFPNWFNYIPTYSATGSMTYTSVTTNLAKFSISGKTVHLIFGFIGTTGGTASYGISFTLPVSKSGSDNNLGFACFVYDGTYMMGGGFSIDADKMEVYKYNYANWGLGETKIARGNLIYNI